MPLTSDFEQISEARTDKPEKAKKKEEETAVA